MNSADKLCYLCLLGNSCSNSSPFFFKKPGANLRITEAGLILSQLKEGVKRLAMPRLSVGRGIHMWQELFPLANAFGKGEGGRGMTSPSRKPPYLMWTLQVSCFPEMLHLLLGKKRRWGWREREWPNLDSCNEYRPISIWSTVHPQQKTCEGEGTSALPSFLSRPLGLVASWFKAVVTYPGCKISTYKL